MSCLIAAAPCTDLSGADIFNNDADDSASDVYAADVFFHGSTVHLPKNPAQQQSAAYLASGVPEDQAFKVEDIKGQPVDSWYHDEDGNKRFYCQNPAGRRKYDEVSENQIITGTFDNPLCLVAASSRRTVFYKVEHYLQQSSGEYKLTDTENLRGTIGNPVKAFPKSDKSYDPYTFNEDKSKDTQSGVVTEDGKLVLKLYYDRKKDSSDDSGTSSDGSSSASSSSDAVSQDTVTADYDGGHSESDQNELPVETQDGQKVISKTVPIRDGFEFKGWKVEGTDTILKPGDPLPAGNIHLTAVWKTVKNSADDPNKNSDGRSEDDSGKKVTGVLLPKVIARGRHTQTLTWTALTNADGYFIYTNQCDEGKKCHPFRKLADYKAAKARVYTRKNLKTGESYKYYVAAYKIRNGKKVIIKNSVTVHSLAGNNNARSTNVKSVRAKKHAVTLKKGQSYTLKASVFKVSRKRAFLESTHCGLVRYLAGNSRIAAVDYNTGKINAKRAGKTTVYVLGVNGIRDKCVVTVK
ncbi:MAG: Ig domain-containing protein [Eubacterium sp.]